MLTFREIIPQDRDTVLPMVRDFYRSEAVLHPVDPEILERSFRAAADPGEPLLRGVLLLEEDAPAGYLYITQCYAAEVGGRCVVLEEIYLKPEFRGRGLGTQVMDWLRKEYPGARRFRLEVTRENAGAVRLYERSEYRYLNYDQMVVDLP